MKIESIKNIKGIIKTIVLFENKRYVRIQKNKYTGLDMKPVIEWKVQKTNHLVKAEKHKLLEEKFGVVDNTTVRVPLYNNTNKGSAQIVASGTTSFYDFKTSIPKNEDYSIGKHKKLIDAKIREYLVSGQLLGAVKYYKEISGLGLKESKDYVDSINAERLAEIKWENGLQPTREMENRERIALQQTNSTFKNNVERDKFLKELKKLYKGNNSLEVVKFIKDKRAWGLYECKMFFDNYVK